MKYVLLLGNETSLDLLFLNLLFREDLPPGEWRVGIESDSSFEPRKLRRYFKALVETGPGFLLFNSLIHLSWGRRFAFPGVLKVETLRRRLGFEVFRFHRVNHPNTVREILKGGPTLILNHMPQILKAPELLRAGVVNVHPGLLPEFQGLGSCLWPLIHNHGFHGTSLHFIDSEKIDAGPLVAVGRIAVQPGESVFALNVKARGIGAKLAARVLWQVHDRKRLQAKPQEQGRYHKLPRRTDLKRLREKHCLIRWADRAAVKSLKEVSFQIQEAATDWKWAPA